MELALKERIRAKLQTEHARISVTLSQFTVPLLSRIYRAFDGDMVSAMVLGELAHRNVLAWLAQDSNPEAPLLDEASHKSVMRPCNALSIAEACDLPRETVRRKVVSLIRRGYVYRSEEGHLYLTADVSRDFEDMTGEIVEALLGTAWQLEDLLAVRRPPEARLSWKPRMASRSSAESTRPAAAPARRRR
jgi:hypothetical protein